MCEHGSAPISPAERSRRDAGFTLVEVLVVLALMSLLTAALFGGLRWGLHVWERVSSRSIGFDQALLVQDFLRRTIGGIYPAFVRDSLTHGHIDFEGARASIRFVARTPIARGVGGYSRYVLSADRSGEGLALTVSAEPESAGVVNTAAVKDILLKRLRSVEFSYFGSDQAEPPRWHDHWTSDRSLPELVRIRLEYVDSNQPAWPDLVIVPRIDVDVGCFFDTLTRRCQGR